MPFDGDEYRLVPVRDNIAKAKLFVEGMSYEQFRDDAKSVYAATRALEIISEASRNLSDELKRRHRTIPWIDIAGAGSICRHDYEDVLEQRVWQPGHEALPLLLLTVDAELAARDAAP